MNSYLRKASCDSVPEGGSVVQLYYLSLPTIPTYEFPHEYPNNEEHERDHKIQVSEFSSKSESDKEVHFFLSIYTFITQLGRPLYLIYKVVGCR